MAVCLHATRRAASARFLVVLCAVGPCGAGSSRALELSEPECRDLSPWSVAALGFAEEGELILLTTGGEISSWRPGRGWEALAETEARVTVGVVEPTGPTVWFATRSGELQSIAPSVEDAARRHGEVAAIVSLVDFTLRGGQLRTGSTDATLVWDARARRLLRAFPGAPPTSGGVAVAPDLTWVVTLSRSVGPRPSSAPVRWDGLTGEAVGQLGSEPAYGLEQSTGARWLAVARGKPARLDLLGVGSWEVVRRFQTGHELRFLTFSSDDTWVAGVASRNEARGAELVETGTGRRSDDVPELATLVAFSPRTRAVAWGCEEGTLVVVALLGGRSAAASRDHDGRITHLAWSPDERYLATGSIDREVCIRNVSH